ncbi:MAG: sigma-E factor negative regulatory protein [Betaproteobacteria bacterium]|nr:sigma-E factor negative regulatory protein [Betaproteobacteria bacterium]
MNDRISQLMDGELGDREALAAIQAVETDASARETWRLYHLIGDAMRDTRGLTPGFADRVAARLSEEPTVLAPRKLPAERPAWLAMPSAIAASLAAVALVGWLAFAPGSGRDRAGSPVAQVPAVQAVIPQAVALQPPTVPLPTATPDYLLAHQGFSPRLSLQGMAAYARTVSDEATATGARR